MSASLWDIAIVGGGCSGLLVATQLLRKGFRGSLAMVEPRARLGQGLAYSTEFDLHLLNVPAGKMSAFPASPAHFLDWLREHGWPDAQPYSFVPRKVYGNYLEDLLRSELSGAPAGENFRHMCGRAAGVKVAGEVVCVALEDGTCLNARRVVLALGNPASSTPVNVAGGMDELFHKSPWTDDALRLRFPDERILLLGTGLTAIDSELAILGQSDQAQVTLVSRRGLLPQVHSSCRPAPPPAQMNPHRSLRLILHDARARIRELEKMGFCWRVAVDALRPVSNDFWRNLPPADQRQFLRLLKPYWEPHRHRMAPECALRTESYRAEGRLRILAGRVLRIDRCRHALQVEVASRCGPIERFEVDRVINCTGIHEDYRKSPRPLIAAIIGAGLACANDLGLGFRTDSNGALIDSAGRSSQVLFTLGPPRRGELFETTAVPEIRRQAESLAEHLLSS